MEKFTSFLTPLIRETTFDERVTTFLYVTLSCKAVSRKGDTNFALYTFRKGHFIAFFGARFKLKTRIQQKGLEHSCPNPIIYYLTYPNKKTAKRAPTV